MHAVVGQEVIATFAQSRACPLHHLATIEESPVRSNADLVAMREALERNLFHRSAPQSVRKAGVVNDAPVTDVDAVMRVERPRTTAFMEWLL
jgi:ornithine carbamoyltransferase